MPVKTKSIIMDQMQRTKQDAAAVLNIAAREHQSVSRLTAPVDTTALRQSIRIPFKAVPTEPTTAVQAGNIEIPGTYKGDVFVDYHLLQNYGYATVNGGHVAGHFYWEQGQEAGKNALINGVKEIARNGRSNRKTFVQTAVGEIGYDANQAGE